jgi:hypothetical protein
MISREEALQKFKEIVGSAESWEQLLQSQFTSHISLFQSWALREALFKTERVLQEMFLSTAINESSIRSHAEDRDYLPIKAKPSTGTVTIKNNGVNTVTIPERTAFQSDDLLYYVTLAPVTIAAGATSIPVNVSQIEERILTHIITEEKKFYEILFDTEVTPEINAFEVWLDESGGTSYTEWSYKRLFQNTAATDAVYDEFYAHTGETGVRFGNGTFGKIPPLSSSVKIKLYLTKGESYLLNNQPLLQIGELLDSLGLPAKIECKTYTVITGGTNQESGEELRRNLHYWPIYNEQLVWQDDYAYFVRREFPQVIWARAWGEQEQTQATGLADLDYINRIFITAHCEEGVSLQTQIIDKLESIPRLNRAYRWVDPVITLFTITITGKVSRSRNIDTVKNTIRDALIVKYGAYSRSRVNEYNEHEAYALIQSLSLFDQQGEYFLVSQAGNPTGGLSEVYGTDAAHIVFDIGY